MSASNLVKSVGKKIGKKISNGTIRKNTLHSNSNVSLTEEMAYMLTTLRNEEKMINADSLKDQHREGSSSSFCVSVLALHNIVSTKMYRCVNLSLEEYFRTKFNISRAQVYRLIDCALVLIDLQTPFHSSFKLKPYPLRQRVAKTIKELAKTPFLRQLLWSTVLMRTVYSDEKHTEINSKEVRRAWAHLCSNPPNIVLPEGESLPPPESALNSLLNNSSKRQKAKKREIYKRKEFCSTCPSIMYQQQSNANDFELLNNFTAGNGSMDRNSIQKSYQGGPESLKYMAQRKNFTELHTVASTNIHNTSYHSKSHWNFNSANSSPSSSSSQIEFGDSNKITNRWNTPYYENQWSPKSDQFLMHNSYPQNEEYFSNNTTCVQPSGSHFHGFFLGASPVEVGCKEFQPNGAFSTPDSQNVKFQFDNSDINDFGNYSHISRHECATSAKNPTFQYHFIGQESDCCCPTHNCDYNSTKQVNIDTSISFKPNQSYRAVGKIPNKAQVRIPSRNTVQLPSIRHILDIADSSFSTNNRNVFPKRRSIANYI